MNSRLRTLSLRAMLALALTLPAAAQATPVTILSGQTMLFNIDLSGATPVPPYALIECDFGIDLAASDASAAGEFQLFGDIDGGGFAALPFSGPIAGLAALTVTFIGLEIEDGLVSFSMRALGGDLTMDAKVQGVRFIEGVKLRTEVFEPVGRLVDSTGPGTVPEPSTAALVLLAAAAMAARGNRRAGHRRLAMQAPLAAPVLA